MTKGRGIVFSIIMLSLPAITALIGIEITSYATIPTVQVRIEGDPIIIHDPEIGFVARPSSQSRMTGAAFDYRLYTDRRGARVSSPGDETPSPADVLIVGDSFTWGHGVEQNETFAHRVLHGLQATGANFGMGSYGTTQSLQMLRRNSDLAPKLIIYSFIADHLHRNVDPCARSYYPFCEDISYVDRRKGSLEIVPAHGDGTTRTERHAKAQREGLDPLTWLIHGIDVAFARATFALTRGAANDQAKQEAALDYLLDEMSIAAEGIGSKLLVVHLPGLLLDAPPPSLLRSVARGKFHFLDLSEAFRTRHQATAGNPPLFIPLDGHPSVSGHALIAEEIIAFVRREGLLKQ